MIQRFYVTANSGSASASAEIPTQCTIVGVMLDIDAVGLVDAGVMEAQLSFGSIADFTTNDNRTTLAHLKATTELTTSGGMQGGKCIFIPMNEAVQPGERLYLHMTTTQTTGTARCLVITDIEVSTGKRVRR